MASAATATAAHDNTSKSVHAEHDHHDHAHSCNDPSHHHDMPSFFDHNDLFSSLAAKKELAAKRKNKKNPQQGVVRAENIPGHRGDQNIDDLLNFINSPTPAGGKKDKKKATN